MGKYVKVVGLREMIQKFAEVGTAREMEKICYRGTYGAAKSIAELAQLNANQATMQNTGALAKAFAIKRIGRGTKLGYSIGVRAGGIRRRLGLSDPFYWWFLEFGFYNTAPRHFFTRAIDALMPSTVKTIQSSGTKEILASANRALKKYGNGNRSAAA